MKSRKIPQNLGKKNPQSSVQQMGFGISCNGYESQITPGGKLEGSGEPM